MEYKDYYKILGVERNTSEKDIKRAYRRLAREFHPDKNPNNKAAEEKFKGINEAYEVLGNPENRAKYDQLGQSYQRYRQMGGAPDGFDFSQWTAAGRPGGGYQQVNIDFEDLFGGSGGFSDFFNSVFGGRFRGNRQAGPDSYFSQQMPSTGQDVEYTVEITLEEAFQGTTRRLVAENSEQFSARIPAGATTGTKVRLRGKGGPGPSGPGDLYLKIKILPHPTFKRQGNNLKTSVTVDVLTAVLGGRVTVPTMDGPVKLTIPPGTQGGRTFRLKGKGMPLLRDNKQFGDLLVSAQIKIPETLSDQERHLYDQLAKLAEDKTK